MRPWTILYGVAAVAALSLPAAGCSSGGDKSGGDTAARITVRMAAMEKRGASYTDAVDHFAQQVHELSGGELRIKVVWNAAETFLGAYGPRAEQDVAALVQRGKLDAALIPARAWDELGVTSLRALQAPFLIESDELVDRIVESAAAGKMLAGLDQAGVVGLTLIPEELRHPVGFARPFLTREDFTGAKIRSPPSDASYRLLRALGAKPVDVSGAEFAAGVADGSIDGAETAFALVGNLPYAGHLTANITFYPKVNAIVVNKDAFGDLSDEHRGILQKAAERTLRYAVRHAPSEAESAAVYCTNGGTIAFAAAADVAALERAARPVYAALEADRETRDLIAQIRRMKRRVSPPRDALPTACAPASGAAATTVSPAPAASSFPEGVYRAEQTAEELIAAGLDSVSAHDEAGIRTLTIEDGRWRDHTQGYSEDCVGTYSVEAGRISLRQDRAECGEPEGTIVMSARWTRKDDQLRFVDFTRGRRPQWAWPWTKID